MIDKNQRMTDFESDVRELFDDVGSVFEKQKLSGTLNQREVTLIAIFTETFCQFIAKRRGIPRGTAETIYKRISREIAMKAGLYFERNISVDENGKFRFH